MKRFLPYLISALAITAMFGGAVYASTPAFTSSQLSTTTPTPGNILETDGSGNHWIANTASGSTLITAGTGISTTTSTGGAVTVTNTGVTSLTAGTNITLSGSTGGVIINASGGGGTGTVSTSTHEIAGEVPYWTSNSGTPALLGQAATSTLTAGTGLTGSFTHIGSGGSIALSVPVSVANGGTATTTFNTGDLLTYNNALGYVTATPDVAVGTVLISNGVGAMPTYSNAPSVASMSASVAISTPVIRDGGLAGSSITIQGTSSVSPTTPTVIIEAASTGLIDTQTLAGFGIGTTTPTTQLSIQGNQYTSGTAFFGGAITATSTLTLSALGTPAGAFLAVNAAGTVITTTTPSGSGSSFSYPFPANATTTPLDFQGGFITNASTTLSQLGTGIVQATNGLLSAAALTSGQVTTALGFTPSSFAFPFTNNAWGESTTSTLGLFNGFIDTASTTFTSSPQFNSLFAQTINPDTSAADSFNFGGRPSVGIPVPYVRPTQSNQNIAFDIFPNGTPSNGFGNSIYGVAWEDICSTDIFAGPNYECLHLGKALNGASNVSSSQGGTGLIQPLELQGFGGNTGIGTDTPYAYFAITASTTAGKPNEPLFAIASSSTDLIVTNGGLVGIGTSSPISPFTVNGGVTFHGLPTGAGNGTVCATTDGLLSYSTTGCTGGGGAGGIADPFTHPSAGQSATTSLMLSFGQASTSELTATSSVYLATTKGGVEIGDANPPSDALDVTGSIFASTYLGVNVPISTISGNTWTAGFESPGGTQNVVSLVRPTNTVNNFIQLVPSGGNTGSNVNWLIGENSNSDSFSFGDYDGSSVKPRMVITDTGLMGLGTTTPWGQLSASSTGAFPTIVANQRGTGPSGIFSGGNVGIGTTSPTAVFVSQAASTTAGTVQTPYVGVVAMITGLENTTLKIFFEIDQWGHQITSGDTPTVTGGTSSVVGNDNNGNITVTGTALTSVVLTFAHAWTAAPDCVTSDNSLTFQSDPTSVSATAITIGFTAGVTTGTVWYQCRQHQ